MSDQSRKTFAARLEVRGLLLPEGIELGAAARKQLLGIGLLVLFLWVLRDKLTHLDTEAILAALAQVDGLSWALAIAATVASFAALAQYDALIHRALATGTAPAHARRGGWTAIAIGQTVGFGLVSGALVRWRMLPDTSLAQASKITATVAATFLAGWSVLTAAVLLVAPINHPHLPVMAVQGLAILGLVMGGGLALMTLVLPEGLRLGRFTLRLPPLAVMARILGLAALDTAFAAAALWALLPGFETLAFFALYPAFLLAQGAGLVSNTPGGVGPFEITLVSLLPATSQPELIAAILAWRIVYYGLPALVAVLLVMLRPAHVLRKSTVLSATEAPCALLRSALSAPQAELGLLRQGEHGLLPTDCGHGGWMVGRAGRALVALLDPFGTAPVPVLLERLQSSARAEGRSACLYKISPRVAAQVRAEGWVVAPVATEVWLDPARFDLTTPARAGLRRKLRKAEKSGLRVTRALGVLPLAEMTDLACAWAAAHGGERGFSMGRFAEDYVSAQQVLLARDAEGRLVGFASFHATATEWGLDLMRPAPDAPDGTMQALIATAITEAAKAGAKRLSLAALPPRSEDSTGPAAALWRRAEKGKGAAGLRQFKMGFGPQLSPRYIAARSPAALMLTAAEIARAIHRPAPLPDPAIATEIAPETAAELQPNLVFASRSS
ncbi:phosphatidylglycerol lysyltransferase [Rhodobacter viridis]|uniref:Phosphatidylglycerol lysyltransferase n=1 Tax=Rhodobacter viridis TaxID=1054202 RepID=A0A318U650_9RHOB|nr:phosphatidylglycerol lysyltransferase domain-containing protein [Rhodobacter viridis]PYF09950.1 phosphatidylglycerol lysyltransferase [Rhodobacter viridis]